MTGAAPPGSSGQRWARHAELHTQAVTRHTESDIRERRSLLEDVFGSVSGAGPTRTGAGTGIPAVFKAGAVRDESLAQPDPGLFWGARTT